MISYLPGELTDVKELKNFLEVECLRLKVKAVIFDIDGTLYKSEKYLRHLVNEIIQTISELLSMPRSDAEKTFRLLRSRFGSVVLGLGEMGVDRREFYSALLQRLDPREFIDPRPEVAELLKKLKEKGCKIAFHTNSSRRLAEMVLEALGIDPELPDILMTCDEAEPKPMLDGYLKILKALKVKPEEVLYVGDRWRVEVEPAKKLGMKTALVSSRPEGDPDLVIGDVSELVGKVECLGEA